VEFAVKEFVQTPSNVPRVKHGFTRARVKCAWAKLRELVPVLTFRGASFVVKGRVYKACVQRVLVCDSETWPVKMEDMQ